MLITQLQKQQQSLDHVFCGQNVPAFKNSYYVIISKGFPENQYNYFKANIKTRTAFTYYFFDFFTHNYN